MPEPPLKRCWDASAFIAWIKDEAGRGPTCERIVQDAREGRCLLYTSMITLAEVTKGRPAADAASEQAIHQTITRFFRNDYVKLIPVDYSIGSRARDLIWRFRHLRPRDAIHLATAVEVGADVFEHYDRDDFGRVARELAALEPTERAGLPGTLPVIREPEWTGQADLFGPVGPLSG